jgi:hypothetical protein
MGCSKRGLLVAGDPPTVKAPCSTAGLTVLQSTVVLHLGQLMVNGRPDAFVSSTCNREEHFWQTIIIMILGV